MTTATITTADAIARYTGRNTFILKLKAQSFPLTGRQLTVAADILEQEADAAWQRASAPLRAAAAAEQPIARLEVEDAGVYVMPQFGRYDRAAEVVEAARGPATM